MKKLVFLLCLLLALMLSAWPARAATVIIIKRPDPDMLRVMKDPRVTEAVATMAMAKMEEMKRESVMFLKAGVDTKDPTSTRGKKAMFTATKKKSMKMGEKDTVKNALVMEMSSILGMNKEQIMPAINDMLKAAKQPEVQSLTTDDDNCDQFVDIQCSRRRKYRTEDGSCNNFDKPLWGRAFIPMRRFLAPQYRDNNSLPRTEGVSGSLPSPREISLKVHSSDNNIQGIKGFTHMVMQWGQFVDHDITSTPIQAGSEGSNVGCCMEDVSQAGRAQITKRPEERDVCFHIPVPGDDPTFRPRSCMNFVRSIQISDADCQFSPVEQMNQITAYLDGSMIYGSSETEHRALRTMTGGLLKTSVNNLLPEDEVPSCIKNTPKDFCFKAGDTRVNEQMALASLHTVWMREHNRVAKELSLHNPDWDDEKLFQEARKIVGAEIQHITYKEFLPIVLNRKFTKAFELQVKGKGFSNVYIDTVDASIRNSFAAAAFRFGHSLVKSMFSRINERYTERRNVDLKESFGNTSHLIEDNGEGVNTYVRGLVTDFISNGDRFMSPQLTQHLFEDPSGHALDLAAINIQRGRDHGLPGYNDFREWCKLPRATTFDKGPGGLVDHPNHARNKLKSVYAHPDDIDLFSGGVSESRISGGLVGPTFACLIAHQFKAIKVGDRFWYEREHDVTGFTKAQLKTIKTTTLAKILCENTDIEMMQPRAFAVPKKNNERTSCSDLEQSPLYAWSDDPKVRELAEKPSSRDIKTGNGKDNKGNGKDNKNGKDKNGNGKDKNGNGKDKNGNGKNNNGNGKNNNGNGKNNNGNGKNNKGNGKNNNGNGKNNNGNGKNNNGNGKNNNGNGKNNNSNGKNSNGNNGKDKNGNGKDKGGTTDRSQKGWTEWSQWNACEEGVSVRTRQCNQGSVCLGSGSHRKACGVKRWTEWGQWAACNNGLQTRLRMCVGVGASCMGMNMENRLCQRSAESSWGAWGTWGACSRGKKLRRRLCQGSAGYGPSSSCVGPSSESKTCTAMTIDCSKSIYRTFSKYLCPSL